MSEIISIQKENEIPIQCSSGEKIKNIMDKLSNKLNIKRDEIFALHNGKILDE